MSGICGKFKIRCEVVDMGFYTYTEKCPKCLVEYVFD